MTNQKLNKCFLKTLSFIHYWTMHSIHILPCYIIKKHNHVILSWFRSGGDSISKRNIQKIGVYWFKNLLVIMCVTRGQLCRAGSLFPPSQWFEIKLRLLGLWSGALDALPEDQLPAFKPGGSQAVCNSSSSNTMTSGFHRHLPHRW